MQSVRALLDPGRVDADRSEVERARLLAELFDFFARGFGLEQRVVNIPGHVGARRLPLPPGQSDARGAGVQRAGQCVRAAFGAIDAVRIVAALRVEPRHYLIGDLFDEFFKFCVHLFRLPLADARGTVPEPLADARGTVPEPLADARYCA